MSWKKIYIGDLGKVITGNTPPKKDPEFYGDDYKFIKPTDMNIDARYTPVTEEHYSLKAYEKYKKSLIPPLSTCVVTIGSIGTKITLTDDNSFVNQAVNAVIPKTDEYDPFFVFYALKNLLPNVKKADTGASSGRENVSTSNFMSLPLEVPTSLMKQKRIGLILSSFDDLIENNIKRINLLEQAAQNIYKEWFVHLRFPGHENTSINEETGLPEGWTERNINEVFNIKYGKNLPATKITSSGKYSVYGASGVMGYYEECNTKIKVALITSRGNGSGDVHRTFQKNTFVTNNSFKVFPKEGYEFYPFFFVTEFLKTLNLLNYCSGSAQPQLTNASMNNIRSIFPNKEMVALFTQKVSPILEQSDVLLKQNQKLKAARDILLPRLMNRTIEV